MYHVFHTPRETRDLVNKKGHPGNGGVDSIRLQCEGSGAPIKKRPLETLSEEKEYRSDATNTKKTRSSGECQEEYQKQRLSSVN